MDVDIEPIKMLLFSMFNIDELLAQESVPMNTKRSIECISDEMSLSTLPTCSSCSKITTIVAHLFFLRSSNILQSHQINMKTNKNINVINT